LRSTALQGTSDSRQIGAKRLEYLLQIHVTHERPA
jgi:hypothetical protein